jgi:regulatory protein
MDAALTMLGRRPYSCARLRVRLQERFRPHDVEPVLRRLEKLGLIDDRRYAEDVVRHRLEPRHYGVSYIRGRLLSEGIEAALADDVLERLLDPESERRRAQEALQAYLQRRRGSGRRTPTDDANAAARHLSNRGFATELIRDLLRESL